MKRIVYLLAAIIVVMACKDERPKYQDNSSTFEGTDVVASPKAWDGTKRAAITYQALVYSFADGAGNDKIGDFNGLTSKLDYLDEMGVGAIWLSPIHPSTSYHGYDVLDYSAVNPDFGTDADFQNLVNEASKRDIKIYIDYVLNHSSSSHPWFLDAVENGEDSEYWDYYAFSSDPEADIKAGNIPQIATEGSSGYDSGQWFATGSGTGAEGVYKFVLNWSASKPTVTVTEASAEEIDDENTSTASGGKYLYFGEDECLRFYETGTNLYELTVDFSSSWGFLIRTSTTSWSAGTKYGAPDNKTIIELGVPFELSVSTSSFDPSDIRFAEPLMYHSHFWTATFADFNYGAADSAEQSGAFTSLTEAGDKWVGMGIGGMRLDAVKHIYHNATSGENPTFLAKFYDRMNSSYKAAGGAGDFYMVGEVLDEYNLVAPYYAGLPALFEFSFWYRLSWALGAETGRYFASDIMGYQSSYAGYRQDYIEATKLSNHDENRTGSDLGKDLNKMKLAAAALLTAGGEPYVYQGEELGYWGTTSGGDEYVRTPIMWDKSGNDVADGYLGGKVDYSMLTSSISVEAQEADESSILNVYRTFGKLRNTYPALAEGKMEAHPIYNENNSDYNTMAVWYMVSGAERALVVHNFGSGSKTLEFDDDLSKPIGLLGSAKMSSDGATNKLNISAYSSVVFDLN
ncbi:MAG: alpha-amylase [Bacteroidales bacterium]|nr:alpha-amylase [Bacteroidales bacterium]